MGKVHERIDGRLREFIERQHVFFVATAPSNGGRVNVSPKGLAGTFAVLDDRRVAYLDLTGSGIETAAHLRENGRITLMFCSFDGPPRILRVHGRGRVVERSDAEWERWRGLFPPLRGERAVVVISAERVSTSCGYGVPLLDYRGERTQMDAWVDRKGWDGIDLYQKEHNVSLDGLPGLRRPGLEGVTEPV